MIDSQRAWEIEHVGINYKRDETGYAFIHVPSEAFLPFCICIAAYCRRSLGLRSVVIFGQWTPGVGNYSKFSEDVILTIPSEEFAGVSGALCTGRSLYISHSYGWVEQDNKNIELIQPESFFVYADGFSNRVHNSTKHHLAPTGAFFFGFRHPECRIDAIHVFAYQEILRTTSLVARSYDLSFFDKEKAPYALKHEKYAVIYMRYWGKGNYCFDPSQTVQVFCDTILASVPKQVKLLVKNDPRVVQEYLGPFLERLEALGYNVEMMEDILSRNGMPTSLCMLPIEYFWSFGWFTKASYHIVFDSTVGFSVAHSEEIRLPTNIVIGGAMSSIHEKYPIHKLELNDHLRLALDYWDPNHKPDLSEAVEWVRYNSWLFSEMITASTEIRAKLYKKGTETLFFVKVASRRHHRRFNLRVKELAASVHKCFLMSRRASGT